MVNVTEVRETAELIVRLARKQQDSFSAAFIVAELAHPVLELMDAMSTNLGQRWRTL
jgi:hypothetical protein